MYRVSIIGALVHDELRLALPTSAGLLMKASHRLLVVLDHAQDEHDLIPRIP